ncbi:hypothetical protein [Limnobacter sp.]|uniref:hypothetical protein n=1 Tax=Limnobacter sp. TaxID=2003368 RepID=UPI003512B01D
MALEELKNGLSAIPVAGEVLSGALDSLAAALPAAPALPGANTLPGLDTLPDLTALPLPDNGLPDTGLPGALLEGGLPDLPNSGLPTPPATVPGLDTLTSLLDGGLPALPDGIPGMDTPPNLDALPELGALPGLDALPVPEGGLPEPSAITDLLADITANIPGLENLPLPSGEAPTIPGGDGDLPASPIRFEDGTLSLSLPEGLPISASASISGLEAPAMPDLPFAA